MKYCCRCKKEQLEICFNIDNNRLDGLYPICKDCRKEEYNLKKQFILQQKREYYKRNREKIKLKNKDYRVKNIELIRLKDNVRQSANKKQRNEIAKLYKSKRTKRDLNYKLCNALRSRMYHAIKNSQKVGSAVFDLGCSVEEVKTYLESKFYPNPETYENMTWDNWGRNGWHIDHITALHKFDLTNREEFLKACHYTNLQPLWYEENLRKTRKY